MHHVLAKKQPTGAQPGLSKSGKARAGQPRQVKNVLRKPVQAKLSVGTKGDSFEKEADRVAEAVVGGNEVAQLAGQGGSAEVQRKCVNCEEIQLKQANLPIPISRRTPGGQQVQRLCSNCEGELQFKASGPEVNAGLSAPEESLEFLEHGGQPLAGSEYFQSRMGYDFSQVRVHTDENAANLAGRLGARAFTYGRHIAFAPGEYRPGSLAGRKLLAHELTHTVQQGAVAPINAVQTATAGATGVPSVQREETPWYERAWNATTSTVSAGAGFVADTAVAGYELAGEGLRAGAEAIGDAAEWAYESVRDWVIDFMEEHAPDILALLRGDVVGTIRQHIIDALDYFFNGFGTLIQEEGVTGALISVFGDLGGTITQIASDLSQGNCDSLFSAFRSLADFSQRLMSPVFEGLRSVLETASGFFGGIWNRFAAPVVDSIGDFLGSAWEWVTRMANRLWSATQPIRDFMSRAWQAFKDLFNIAWDSTGDAIGWLMGKAQEAWDAVKEWLGPFLLPLQIAAGIFLMFTPLGPILAITVGGPLLWDAIMWLRDNWDDLEIVIRARQVLNESILPALRSGLQWVQGALQTASAWLTGMMASIVGALASAVAAISSVPVLGTLLSLVTRVMSAVGDAAAWLLEHFVALLIAIKDMAATIWSRFIRPLLGLVAAIILFPVYPFLLPVVLTGWAWRLLPDCFKPPIIDFFIRCAISVVTALPEFEMFGEAWPQAKVKVIEVLETAKEQPIERKIEMSNRIAKMMTGEDLAWIGNLVRALIEMPNHFMGQAQEELIGMNLTQPLPFERTERGPQSRNAGGASLDAGLIRRLASDSLGDSEVAVDRVANTTWHPELVRSLNLADGATRRIGDGQGAGNGGGHAVVPPGGAATPGGTEALSNDPEVRLQEMMAQPLDIPCESAPPPGPNSEQASSGNDIPEEMKFGPLTQAQRGRYLLNRMGHGIGHWFDCNKHWLIPLLIVTVVALIALEIVSGGAVTAALPLIAEVLGLIFVGVAVVRAAYYLGEYLARGVAGQIVPSAVALARGLAVGAIELVFALLFNIGAVIKSLKQGARSSMHAAAGAARQSVRRGLDAASELPRVISRGAGTTARNVRNAGRAVVNQGRVMLGGVQDGIGQGIRSLDDLARRLRTQLGEFRGFRFKRAGRILMLQALFNPWVTISQGRIDEVDEGTEGALELTDDALDAARRGGEARTGAIQDFEVANYRETTSSGRGVSGDMRTGDHVPSRAAVEHNLVTREFPNVNPPLTRAESLQLARGNAVTRTVGNSTETLQLTDEVAAAVRRDSNRGGLTVVIPDSVHRTASRTYAGRNSASQIVSDASDLGEAFRQDVNDLMNHLASNNQLTPAVVGAYQRAYRENVARGIIDGSNSSAVDAMFRDFLVRATQ